MHKGPIDLADGGHTEGHHVAAAARGVAHEIALQLFGVQSLGQLVVRQGKVVEADVAPAALAKGCERHLKDRELGGRVRRGIGFQRRLVLLHPRHMRIVEQGHALGADVDYALDGAPETVHRLVRQTIDQVDVDRTNAGGAGSIDDDSRLLFGLHARDGFLDFQVKVLHPE